MKYYINMRTHQSTAGIALWMVTSDHTTAYIISYGFDYSEGNSHLISHVTSGYEKGRCHWKEVGRKECVAFLLKLK